MEVLETIVIDNEHSIEFGNSTWDKSEMSIRRRKDNQDGRFNPHGSSEIPIDGYVNISDLFIECLRRDFIDAQTLSNIMNEIVISSNRQNLRINFS